MQILQQTPSEPSRERNALVLSFPSSLNRLQAASYLAHMLGKRTLGMKLQDRRPTRDRPDVCHVAQFIRFNPHGAVELWSKSDSNKCHMMSPYCSSNLDLSMFLSPASKTQLKTHNLVNKYLRLCHSRPGVETPKDSPWGLTRNELLSGAHDSLRSSPTALPKPQELTSSLETKQGSRRDHWVLSAVT